MATKTRIPKLEGFTLTRVTAVWVGCNNCEEMELIFGEDIEGNAAAWAHRHRSECDGR